MAIIPLNIAHSSQLNAICLITPSSIPTNEESIIVLIDSFTHELWYTKNQETFPFSCLSLYYSEQLYNMLRKDERALEALQHLEISQAVEVYTKVAYGGIAPKMIMELMN